MSEETTVTKFSREELEWYDAYEAVRVSGVTNMFDLRTVRELSGLTREQILFCMTNFESLKEEASR